MTKSDQERLQTPVLWLRTAQLPLPWEASDSEHPGSTKPVQLVGVQEDAVLPVSQVRNKMWGMSQQREGAGGGAVAGACRGHRTGPQEFSFTGSAVEGCSEHKPTFPSWARAFPLFSGGRLSPASRHPRTSRCASPTLWLTQTWHKHRLFRGGCRACYSPAGWLSLIPSSEWTSYHRGQISLPS